MEDKQWIADMLKEILKSVEDENNIDNLKEVFKKLEEQNRIGEFLDFIESEYGSEEEVYFGLLDIIYSALSGTQLSFYAIRQKMRWRREKI